MSVLGEGVEITYTMSETAALLKCSRPKLYDLMHEGFLRTYTVGRKRYVAHQDLVGCLDRLREERGGLV